MEKDEITLHQEAIDLLTHINKELKSNKMLSTINIKMVGVIKDLNEIMVASITGADPE